MATIEHMGDLSRETLDAAASANVVIVPTLSVMAWMAETAPAERRDRTRRRLDATAAAFGRALASGVRIACGTDIGCFPHARGSLSELRHMMDFGMTGLQALRAATGEGATLLGLPGGGVLRAGAPADLCAFELGPDGDVGSALCQRPKLVIQRGCVVRGELPCGV